MKNSIKWDPKKLGDWLKKHFTLQNFILKWSILDKLLTIWQSECKNVTEYIS